ncbi:Maf family protein [Paramicrobacterium chengjingii]|uniref:Nucleoside triphosphate pyrophosphatase n=1 Tax=Paramicrobacterium chengjingii TaxID=2769067 RepID=A0ABX6YLS9_9MICO|nr:nucleoside triphosphate pyrophosphatase [Microbacterium chengjingii]QPZ39361.1 septum formation inhibitor Maf [Microbacterium chengjingii]
MPVFHLASTSPARRMLLKQAGIDAHAFAPDVDEDAAVESAEREAGAPLAPEQTVELLARAKAEAGATLLRQRGETSGLVFGGDSVFVLDGTIYGKPHTPDEARRRWLLQRGRTGTLFSGHCLIDLATDAGAHSVSASDVSFAADMTDGEIDAYIASGEPLSVAGAFTIDSLGSAFIDSVSGDPSTVVGLSIPALRRLVRELGFEWTQLWQTPPAQAG